MVQKMIFQPGQQGCLMISSKSFVLLCVLSGPLRSELLNLQIQARDTFFLLSAVTSFLEAWAQKYLAVLKGKSKGGKEIPEEYIG